MEVARRRTSFPGASRRGLTFVETMITVLIAGTLVVMALNAFGSLARTRQAATLQHTAAALARGLLSEILATQYDEPLVTPVFGPETGELRAGFNDVDDYNNLVESPPEARDGTDLPGLAGWTRAVAVAYVDPRNLDTVVGTDMGLKRITVTVTDPRGSKTTAVALRARTGADDSQNEEPTTYVSGVAVSVQIGPAGNGRVTSGVHILNLVPSGD